MALLRHISDAFNTMQCIGSSNSSISSCCPSFSFSLSFYSFFYVFFFPSFHFSMPPSPYYPTSNTPSPILDNLSLSLAVSPVLPLSRSLSVSLSHPNSILRIPPSTLLHLIVDLRVVAMSTSWHITMATSLSETRLLIRERCLV